MNDTVTALFAGPDDESTCDTGGPEDGGCEQAVNNNRYTLDTVPEPGSFACQSGCRHMVQIDGEAPDGVETMDWSSSAGFTVGGDAADAGAIYGDNSDATGAERVAAAAIELPDLTGDELAIIDMGPSGIAQYLKDNDLQISDVDAVLNSDEQAEVRAEMQAIDYAPVDTADATELTDLLAAGADDGIKEYIDTNGLDDAKQLAKDGFDDSDSAQAYYLADALDEAESDA
jgi:hypothetical protein